MGEDKLLIQGRCGEPVGSGLKLRPEIGFPPTPPPPLTSPNAPQVGTDRGSSVARVVQLQDSRGYNSPNGTPLRAKSLTRIFPLPPMHTCSRFASKVFEQTSFAKDFCT